MAAQVSGMLSLERHELFIGLDVQDLDSSSRQAQQLAMSGIISTLAALGMP